MRLLAALVAVSGVGWLLAFVTANQGWAYPQWGFIATALAYLAAAAAVLATARSAGHLPSRLAGLWLVAVALVCVAFSGAGLSIELVGMALLYGTIAFGVWFSLPLVVFSFVRDGSSA